ncbi:MAG: hypothetical protein U1E76_11690 [Planctomycetota bacterium]
MNTPATSIVFLLLAGATAIAGGSADSTIWSAAKGGLIDSGWIVSAPAGSEDYFDQTYMLAAGIDNSEDGVLASGLAICGTAVSVADFGSGRTYPRVGVFLSNLAVDSTGETPDLANAVAEAASPPLGQPELYHFVAFDLGKGTIPGGVTRVHAVAQLPPGDPGLLGIGADSHSSGTTGGYAGFTTDGYQTPSQDVSFLDFGLNPGQDNSTTTSCKPADRLPHGRLRGSSWRQGVGEGDKLTLHLRAGARLDLAFFGTRAGDRLRIYANTQPCAPAVPVGPVLTASGDPDGDGSYLRIHATWPSGIGGTTVRFSAVWGNAACAAAGAGFTNCITIIAEQDLPFGACDDGTIESAWVVQIPSGPSDYFNNHFGDGRGVPGVVGLTIAVLDFGAYLPLYPSAGVSNANLALDASGFTPDLAAPLALVAPFTFPPGTIASTSAQYIRHAISVAGSSLGTHVHAWVQFPPGDSGLLAVGADTTSSVDCSFFSLDGYATPALATPPNWGLRLRTN